MLLCIFWEIMCTDKNGSFGVLFGTQWISTPITHAFLRKITFPVAGVKSLLKDWTGSLQKEEEKVEIRCEEGGILIMEECCQCGVNFRSGHAFIYSSVCIIYVSFLHLCPPSLIHDHRKTVGPR